MNNLPNCYRCHSQPCECKDVAIKPPFPWFGGKSSVAPVVWRRLGDVRNYVEPFAGSLAVLLNRPHPPGIETVNDLDCYLSNFWRAVQHDHEQVAKWADYPVNEADLHARHNWLLDQKDFRRRMHAEPDFFDAKIAGWWVWGLCMWIGSGWCNSRLYDGGEWQQRPRLSGKGMGVHRPSQKLPHLGNSGRGVHRPKQQRPHLSGKGLGVHRSSGRDDLYEYMELLTSRLRHVRVCCGDWSRVCGPTPTIHLGVTGVFLDPPYTEAAGRDNNIYSVDSTSVGYAVRDWAVERGGDKRIRIALCGYEGEYEMPDDWDCVAWKARGGYGSQGNGKATRGRDNSHKERIWFSPHCVADSRFEQGVFFGDENE